jgi:UDP-N-acetylmuramoyl-L-alanyl-D-glutamate--2,6-diaminopimelate ligase
MDAAPALEALVAGLPRELVVQVIDAVPPRNVVDLTHDSRQVRPGWGFACVVGEHLDGHQFAATALDAGASVLLVEHPVALDVAQVVVTEVRRAMGYAAAVVHGNPANALTTVGITGTNGKTSTTHVLAAILEATGRSTRTQGTLSGARTTPEATDLQRLLAGYVAEGVEALVMEVSSHALALHRVNGMRFDAAVFTNLGRDHLDLHGSVEAYFRAKAELFEPRLSEVGITNLDDPRGRLLFDVAPIPMVGYELADASSVAVAADHVSFVWRDRPVNVPLGGRFSVINSIAALTTATVLGVSEDDAVGAIAGVTEVAGRFEVVSDPAIDPISVVVDYAHTPDALVEVLTTARSIAGSAQVIVVFGCGGDRDVDKRPLMGAAAGDHADLVWITSDNPRHEDPQAIADAAAAGVEPGRRDRLRVDLDRDAAISAAIDAARPGDVVVIAGKGHETTQTIGDLVQPFDDREVARRHLARRARQTETGGIS